MMKFISLFLAIMSVPAFGQGTVSSTCIWQGTVAACLPADGLLLSNQRDLRLGEASGSGTNYVALQAPATLGSDITLTLPSTAGNNLEFLQTNGSGTLTWADALINPMTTRGDLIRGGASGVPERVSAATDNRVVRGDGTDVISGQIDDPAFFTSGAQATSTVEGVVKGGTLPGNSGSAAIGAGYAGEYKSVAVSSTITTAANTWTDVTGSLTLDAGTWMIGYDVTLFLNDVATGQTVNGNVVIYNGSANLNNTIAIGSKSGIASVTYSIGVPTSRSIVVDITSSTTYSLRIRCSLANTSGTCGLPGTDITGALTNPDNAQILWARRL